MTGKYSSVQNAVEGITAETISDEDVSIMLDEILSENASIIDKQHESFESHHGNRHEKNDPS